MSPDYYARRLLVSSYCYYISDESIITDAEYDRLSLVVADAWDQLPPLRQWCLGKPDDIRATGCHFRFTTLNIGAARQLCRNHPYPRLHFSKKWNLHYCTSAGLT